MSDRLKLFEKYWIHLRECERCRELRWESGRCREGVRLFDGWLDCMMEEFHV